MELLTQAVSFLNLCFTWRWASLVAQMVKKKKKNLPEMQEAQVQPLGREGPQRRSQKPTPVFLPGESHGQRSLAGYSPPGRKESDEGASKCSHGKPHNSQGDPHLIKQSTLSPKPQITL